MDDVAQPDLLSAASIQRQYLNPDAGKRRGAHTAVTAPLPPNRRRFLQCCPRQPLHTSLPYNQALEIEPCPRSGDKGDTRAPRAWVVGHTVCVIFTHRIRKRV